MRRPPLTFPRILATLVLASAAVSADTGFEACKREAEPISGFHGEAERRVLGGALKGGLGGAALGAAGGWVFDSDKKKTAKRGAARRAHV